MAGELRSISAAAVLICCMALATPGFAGTGAEMTGEWRLVAIDRTQLSRGGTPTVMFGDEGSCWGSTGVNEFRTTFTLDGLQVGQVKVGNAAVTRKLGPPEAMAVEKLFLDRLESAISYEVRGDLLHLHSGENRKLTFERVYRK